MKYVYFHDYSNDGLGGIVEISEEEWQQLEPHRYDMSACNPFPNDLDNLVWENIYGRETVDKDPETLSEEECLTQAIC